MEGRCETTSKMPTTATSLASMTVSHPALRMRSPPRPKNSMDPKPREAASLCRASISPAPYISPEASPAEISTRMDGGRITENQLPVLGSQCAEEGVRSSSKPTPKIVRVFEERGTNLELGTTPSRRPQPLRAER